MRTEPTSFFEQLAEMTRPIKPTCFGPQVSFDEPEAELEIEQFISDYQAYKAGKSKAVGLKSIESAISALKVIERRAEEV